LGPRFTIYVISFFVIGAYWISYHHIFNRIADSHGVIVWLNLAFLFFITLIPFAVDLQVDFYFYQIIFIIYAMVLTAAGLSLTLIWLYASKNKLVDKRLNHTEEQVIYGRGEAAKDDDDYRCPICISRIDEFGYCACGGNLGVS
jgi:uncharacterized membrane protein